ERLLQRQARFTGNIRPPKTNYINSHQKPEITANNREGRNILADAGKTTDHRELANAGELVNRRVTGNEHAVLDRNVPGKTGVVGQDNIVAEQAIMRHVAGRHKHVVVADDCLAAFFDATMN